MTLTFMNQRIDAKISYFRALIKSYEATIAEGGISPSVEQRLKENISEYENEIKNLEEELYK